VTAAGLKPVHQRVTANAQRLSRAALTPAAPMLVMPMLAATTSPVKRKAVASAPAKARRRGTRA
jgi:hypothetical protein